MKKSLLLLACCTTLITANSQLVNNGATIRIMPGAYIKCTGNVQNNSGTITNDGKLEVQGNFVNAAIYNTTTADDSLIMSGTGNVTLNGGASTYSFLTISKTNATDEVKLAASFTLTNVLDYTQGNFTTDPIANPAFQLSSPATATYNFAAGKEITGRVTRTSWTNGTMRLFNSANMQVTTNGGTNPTSFTVTMIPQAGGGDPTQAEREVKRKFNFATTGGTGYTADIRFPYNAGELNTNTETNLVPWELITAEWNGRLTPVSRDAVNDWVSTTGVAATALANEWKLADPRYTFNVTAYMRGAWNAGGFMNTTLNPVLPLSQPYNVTPISYTGTETVPSINSNIVDWVLVELRKPASGLPADATAATFVGRKALFINNAGTLVEYDNTPAFFDINKQGAGFFVIRHRNHIAVMSNSLPSNATGTYSNNFTTLAGNYTNPGLTNAPVQALPSSASLGMWAGNANRDGVVNASDIALIRSQANAVLTGYQFGDINMDQFVNASDVGLARTSANATATTHSSRVNGDNKKKELTSHVPN